MAAETQGGIDAAHALFDAGRHAEALAAYQALLAEPALWRQALLGRAQSLRALGQVEEARRDFELLCTREAEWFPALYNCGLFLLEIGQAGLAETRFRQAVAVAPERADGWIGLALAQEDQGRIDAAIDSYRALLARVPSHTGATGNLAALLRKRGDLDEAVALLESRQAQDVDGELRLRLAAVKAASGEHEVALAMLEPLLARPSPARLIEYGFVSLAAEIDPLASLKHLSHAAARLFPAPSRPAPRARPGSLHLALLSSDLRGHPIACFVAPLLRHAASAGLRITCLSNNPRDDAVTAGLKTLGGCWVSIRGVPAGAVAQYVRQAGVDLLIDLNGWSGEARPDVVTALSAVVPTAGWLGYLGSTGLPGLHYRICDALTDPQGLTEAHHSEQLLRLPRSQWCYEAQFVLAEATPLPLRRNGCLTFLSPNQAVKVTDACLQGWREILQQVPDSRLIVASIDSERQARRIQERIGLPGRVEVRPRGDLRHYLALYAEADVVLDTYPYCGATTTIEALLHGLPVLSRYGARSVSRGGLSLNTAAGLGDWCWADRSQLPARLPALLDPEALAELRATLRARVQSSPLCDGRGMLRDLTNTLLGLPDWRD